MDNETIEISKIASRYKNIEEFKELDDESIFYSLCLLLLFNNENYKTQKLWESFAEEVKTKNRFFPDMQLQEKIKEISDKATLNINKGFLLYRAREYSKKDLLNSDSIRAYIKSIKDDFLSLGYDEKDIFNEFANNNVLMYLDRDPKRFKELKSRYNSLLDKNTSFHGFNEDESDAPPVEFAKEGRANPKGISYLYTATNINTAILEMRPEMEKMYSVATIEIIKDCKIFDFTYPEKTNDKDYFIINDLHIISKEFSKPCFGNSIEYVPTQYICEYIKSLGFDGIKYNSAVSKEGTNILLFDVNKDSRVYKINGSEVYTVNSINLDISQSINL